MKARLQVLRETILNAYGHDCVCCGEWRDQFLGIDHINGGGRQHRKETGTLGNQDGWYKWIIANNFPDFLRVLCHNCNLARGFYGFCPHEDEELIEMAV